MLLGERVHRVLRRIRRQTVRIVIGQMDISEIAAQRHADVVVDNLVRIGIAEHTDDPRFRLTVLIVPERDTHVFSSLHEME